jgi:hypothetical protein
MGSRCNKVLPAHTPSAETVNNAAVAPIHTGNGRMLLARPATAICVLSPNSEIKISSRLVKNMPWPVASATSSTSPSSRCNRMCRPKNPNSNATEIAMTRSGINKAAAAPNITASVFRRKNATATPANTGQWRCRAASVMQTSWLLSPISASATSVNVDREIEIVSGGSIKAVVLVTVDAEYYTVSGMAGQLLCGIRQGRGLLRTAAAQVDLLNDNLSCRSHCILCRGRLRTSA